MIPEINQSHGSSTRNIINATIKSVNAQGKSIQDLVAEGQLSPSQYAELITAINANVSRGKITADDLDKSGRLLDATFFTSEFLEELNNSNINATKILSESVSNHHLTKRSVSLTNLDFTSETDNLFDGIYVKGLSLGTGTSPYSVISSTSGIMAIVPIEKNKEYFIRKFGESDRYRYAFINKYPEVGDTVTGKHSHGVVGDLYVTDSNSTDKYLLIVVSNSGEKPKLNVTENEDSKEYIPYKIIGSEYVEKDPDVLKQLDFVRTNQMEIDSFSLHSINVNTGIDTTNNAHVKTEFIRIKPGEKIDLLEVNDVLNFRVFIYDLEENYIRSTDYLKSFESDGEYLVRLTSRKSDNSSITGSDIDLFKGIFHLRKTSYTQEKDKQIIDSLTSGMFFINDWSIGQLALASGEFYADRARVYTPKYYRVSSGVTIKFNNRGGAFDGFLIAVYDLDFNYTGYHNYRMEHTFDEDCYFRLVSRYTNLRVIEKISDFNNIASVQTGSSAVAPLSRRLFGDFNKMYKSEPCEDVSAGKEFSLWNSSIEDIYERYDDILSANALTMSKRIMGYGATPNGSDDTNLPVYEYTIEQPSVPRLNDNQPTILIIAGTHGNEHSPVWSLLQFVKQMMANHVSNDTLSSILANATFKIIPILNPGGYNDKTRTNRNGVDINRNFNYSWSNFDSAVKGSEPYSEPESKIMRDWFEENKNKNPIYIDFHNTGEEFGSSYIDTHNENLYIAYSNMMVRLTNHWIHKYNESLNEVNAFRNRSAAPMIYNDARQDFGIELSGLLEVAWDEDGIRYTSKVIERGVDLIANYIQVMYKLYENS